MRKIKIFIALLFSMCDSNVLASFKANKFAQIAPDTGEAVEY